MLWRRRDDARRRRWTSAWPRKGSPAWGWPARCPVATTDSSDVTRTRECLATRCSTALWRRPAGHIVLATPNGHKTRSVTTTAAAVSTSTIPSATTANRLAARTAPTGSDHAALPLVAGVCSYVALGPRTIGRCSCRPGRPEAGVVGPRLLTQATMPIVRQGESIRRRARAPVGQTAVGDPRERSVLAQQPWRQRRRAPRALSALRITRGRATRLGPCRSPRAPLG
jgi:hypothetical protein